MKTYRAIEGVTGYVIVDDEDNLILSMDPEMLPEESKVLVKHIVTLLNANKFEVKGFLQTFACQACYQNPTECHQLGCLRGESRPAAVDALLRGTP